MIAARITRGIATLMLAAVLGAPLPGCNKCDPAEPRDNAVTLQPVLMTTFHPTEYFARRIIGTAVPLEVVNPVPPEEDPAGWRPADDVIARYQLATLIVINGASFEQWTATAALPRSRIVDTTAGLDEPLITYATTTHSHGPAGEHTHAGVNGHTWLDPITASAQASAIADALAERYPDHAAAIDTNLAALLADLEELDARWRALAPALNQATLFASHPSYDYPARRYGFEIINLDLDPSEPLTRHDLDTLSSELPGDAGAAHALLLWEDTPAHEPPELAALGIRGVVFAPAERAAVSESEERTDYLAIMHANLDRLEHALQQSRPLP